uniref:Astacin domain-containing protein n=1 Tax=Parastrongyloides trichosuri TaxID=131310 RepID=A0A0N4ZLH3_PARTI
ELNTYTQWKNQYVNVPYFFSGITLCRGYRQSNVRIELGFKYGRASYPYSVFFKNYTDKYGVFMFNTNVEQKFYPKLELTFSHCCGFIRCQRNSYKAKCSLRVPSLNCTRFPYIVERKCELGEIELSYEGNCKLLNSTKKLYKKYTINKWNVNISYFIFNNFTNITETTRNIQTVLTEIENNTCIKFFKKNKTIDKNEIHFLKSNKCESEIIGMKSENKSQYIYLTDECSYSMRKIRSL